MLTQDAFIFLSMCDAEILYAIILKLALSNPVSQLLVTELP
jgi:hypothetical protein